MKLKQSVKEKFLSETVHINKFIVTLFCQLTVEDSLRRQTGVAYKQGSNDGSLLSYALISSSCLFRNVWVAYCKVFTSRLLN